MINSILLATGCLSLVACDRFVKRDCGVFDHPDLRLWHASNEAGTVTFGAEDGTTRDYIRTATTFNEPFVQSDPGSQPSDVGCLLTATNSLIPADGSFTMSSEFHQLEELDIEAKDERLRINTFLDVPESTVFNGYIIPFEASENRIDQNNDDAISYAETEEINGFVYDSVVTIQVRDQFEPGAQAPLRSSDLLTDLTYAHTYGIVAYRERSGKRFARIPD